MVFSNRNTWKLESINYKTNHTDTPSWFLNYASQKERPNMRWNDINEVYFGSMSILLEFYCPILLMQKINKKLILLYITV